MGRLAMVESLFPCDINIYFFVTVNYYSFLDEVFFTLQNFKSTIVALPQFGCLCSNNNYFNQWH